MNKNTTYALFGGSFDPPHLGHKEIIKEALKLKEIDKIVVTPTYLNPFKSSFNTSPQKRLEWCKKTFNIKNVEFSDFEIKQKRAVYTIETYNELSKKYNIKAIIIGADNLKNITKWKEFKKLNEKIIWIIASRANSSLDTSSLKEYKIIPLNQNISSTQIREGKKLEFIDKTIEKEVVIEYNLITRIIQ